MLDNLARELRSHRETRGASLEAVATPSKISAAYLHKLERGTVNNPSPRVLARIAATLDVPYLRLMNLAGYLDGDQLAAVDAEPKPHPLAERGLTPEEWAEVGRFVDELIARRTAQ